MSNIDNISIKEDLEKIYADVSEWLKFAEAKHAAALALWTALIVAVMSIELSAIDFRLYCLLLILFIIGMFIDVLAFLPFINKSKIISDICYKIIIGKRNVDEFKNNIIFYKNIFLLVGLPSSEMDIRIGSYKDVLKEKYGVISQDKLIDSYIEQIISVSTIASIKTFLFSVVARYIFVLVIVALAGIIIA